MESNVEVVEKGWFKMAVDKIDLGRVRGF